MNNFQNKKQGIITAPAAKVKNASFTTLAVDTLGFSKLAIYAILGDTDIAMTALKLQESDDSGMSGATDITGSIYGATGAPALPTATDDNKIFAFFVDLKGRKRYIDLVATAGNGSTGTFLCATYELGVGNETTDTAAERGLAANVIIPSL